MKLPYILTTVTFLAVSSSANAAFVERLGGLAYYDTELGISWLTDANAGAGSAYDDGTNNVDGRMSWGNANNWAASLNVAGITGWRLASMDVNGDDAVVVCSSASATDCKDNEYGYHFYQNDINSMFPDVFENIQTNNYWSSTDSGGDAWLFDFNYNDGSQLTSSQNYKAYAWAVYDGDVGAVPIPAAAWLFGSGLLCLAGVTRRKN